MVEPSIMLDTQDGKHKLIFNKSVVVGTDFDEYKITIPIICDKCDFRIFQNDNLIITEVNERNMGNEIYRTNNMDDIYCPKCKASIHIKVEISEYANNLMFHDYEIENCQFSDTYNIQKLTD